MSRRPRDELILIPVDRLYSKYECLVEGLDPQIGGQLNFDSHLKLFLDITLCPNRMDLVEREVDFVTDLMMFDIERREAEEMLSRAAALTKALIERVSGLRVHHLNEGWTFLHRRKDTVVVRAKI